ncbi:hypothetical protein ACFVIM_18645 [Streptomyces sp. NPDC057638]|uniref:hypothetical protein n=1 Tax=Streptomyces sp. NPDC057638 TaxID=3346190 RepID=UPI0036A3C9DB
MRVFHGRRPGTVPLSTSDRELDAAARILLDDLRGRDDGEKVTLADVADRHGLPARRIHSAARALITTGHLLRVKYEADGRWATDLYVYPTPATDDEVEAVRAKHQSATSVTIERPATAGTEATGPTARPGSAPLPEDIDLATATAVRRVLEALPGQLTRLLPTPLPVSVQSAATAALAAGRTSDELAARVLRRWWEHGYATKATELDRPVGVAIALLRPGPCPDPRCEDGTVLDSEAPCVRCAERRQDHHRAQAAAPATSPRSPGPAPPAHPTPVPPQFADLPPPGTVSPEIASAGAARVRAALAATKTPTASPPPASTPLTRRTS